MKNNMISVAAALAVAAILTLISYLPFMYNANAGISDSIYQEASASDGNIVMVGIDDKAIDMFGPYQTWTRDIVAGAVDILNSNPETAPAVIGIDILYTGESSPESDEMLSGAALRGGNVVCASAATFGSRIENDTINNFAVLNYEEPFTALKEAAAVGHINAMQDNDSYMRHSLLYIDTDDGRRVMSMPWTIAEKYREYQIENGIVLDKPALPPTDGRGFWYLPFKGTPGAFIEGISIADIYTGEVPLEYFAGKIVMIGPLAAGLQDSYYTAIDHSESMYGVEIQANAITAILEGNYKKEMPRIPQLIILFVILTLTCFAFKKLDIKISTIIWIVLAGGYLLLCKGLYNKGIVLDALYLPLTLTIVYIACIAFNYIRELVAKKKMQGMFSRYVDPRIIKDLMKEDSDSLGLGGKLMRVAVLFVDIRGFTTMSESLSPEEVVEILNKYLTLTSDCIFTNHGTLDKFVGDCTMAFWGAPIPQEDYVLNACKCAMDMVKGSESLAKELMERFGRTVSFGIGINVGDAVIGNIGSDKRMDYTAIGDTVNTASRLEANAPAGTIYISRAVADELGDKIKYHSIGDTIKLKGKKDGFEILVLDEVI